MTGGFGRRVAREVELKQSTHIETDVKHSPRGEKSNALEKPQSHEPRVKQQWLGVCRLLATPLCQLRVVTSTFPGLRLMVIVGRFGNFDPSFSSRRAFGSLVQPHSPRRGEITRPILFNFERIRRMYGGCSRGIDAGWIYAKDSEYLLFHSQLIFNHFFPRNLYPLNERLKFEIFSSSSFVEIFIYLFIYFVEKMYHYLCDFWYVENYGIFKNIWYTQKNCIHYLNIRIIFFLYEIKRRNFDYFSYTQRRAFSFFFSTRKILILLSKYSNNFSYVNLPNNSITWKFFWNLPKSRKKDSNRTSNPKLYRFFPLFFFFHSARRFTKIELGIFRRFSNKIVSNSINRRMTLLIPRCDNRKFVAVDEQPTCSWSGNKMHSLLDIITISIQRSRYTDRSKNSQLPKNWTGPRHSLLCRS